MKNAPQIADHWLLSVRPLSHAVWCRVFERGGWIIAAIGWLSVVPAVGFGDDVTLVAVGLVHYTVTAVDGLARYPGWQGVGAIAGIIAIVLALRAVELSRVTLRRTEQALNLQKTQFAEERAAAVEQVAPRWHPTEEQFQYLQLQNVGNGPALNLMIIYERERGIAPTFQFAREAVVQPGGTLAINLGWDEEGAAVGRLHLIYSTLREVRREDRVLVVIQMLPTRAPGAAGGRRLAPYLHAMPLRPGETLQLGNEIFGYEPAAADGRG